jgi:hypothetical protein
MICTAILYASKIHAQAVPLEKDGVSGVWMPSDMANKVLADVSELQLQKSLKLEMDSLLKIREERIVAFKEALDASEAIEQRTMKAMDDALKAKEEAEKKLNAWYRSPVFWAIVGGVVTVGLEVGAIKLFQAVD